MTLHRGKLARHPTITNVRALTRDDLMVLKSPTGKVRGDAPMNVIMRLRDPHHRVARLVAAGLRPSEIAERTGYSITRIGVLARDPAFIELVAGYREKVDAAYEREQDEYAKLTMGNMIKAETQIAEKLEAAEETGEFLPTRDLISISRDAADRFGYGKRQMNLNVNADFASLLEKAIARSGKAPTTIEAAPIQPGLPQSPRSRMEVPAFPSDSGELIEAGPTPASVPASRSLARRI